MTDKFDDKRTDRTENMEFQEARLDAHLALNDGNSRQQTLPIFKAGDSVLCGSNGGFDSDTLPPYLFSLSEVTEKRGDNK